MDKKAYTLFKERSGRRIFSGQSQYLFSSDSFRVLLHELPMQSLPMSDELSEFQAVGGLTPTC
jgi:hypothetical protein